MTALPFFSSDEFDTAFFEEAEATWECPTCGIMKPYKKVINSGKRTAYYKRRCDCILRKQREREHAAQRRLALEKRINETFGSLITGSYVYPYRKRTFSAFDERRQHRAFAVAQAFAEELNGTLVLHGPYGTGKTHLLAAICNTLIDREVGCLFLKAPDLFDMIQTYMDKHWDYQNVINQAIWTPLLVIDDVDKISPSAWRQERLYDIIDKRTELEKPIAISTNQLDELDTFVGGACADRLSIGQIAVEMVGESYRKRL